MNFYNTIPQPPADLEACLSSLIIKIEIKNEWFTEFGRWKEMNAEDFWKDFVKQILVRGEDSQKSEEVANHANFSKIMSLEAIKNKKSSERWQVVREFLEAFEFEDLDGHIRDLSRNLKSFLIHNSNPIPPLLRGILDNPYSGNDWTKGYEYESALRDKLAEEVCGFREKSASDYLITIGFVRFLIALDWHITRILSEKCKWTGLDVRLFQNENPKIRNYNYRFVEKVLVDLCDRNYTRWQLLPAQLDRVLFHLGKNYKV